MREYIETRIKEVDAEVGRLYLLLVDAPDDETHAEAIGPYYSAENQLFNLQESLKWCDFIGA